MPTDSARRLRGYRTHTRHGRATTWNSNSNGSRTYIFIYACDIRTYWPRRRNLESGLLIIGLEKERNIPRTRNKKNTERKIKLLDLYTFQTGSVICVCIHGLVLTIRPEAIAFNSHDRQTLPSG